MDGEEEERKEHEEGKGEQSLNDGMRSLIRDSMRVAEIGDAIRALYLKLN